MAQDQKTMADLLAFFAKQEISSPAITQFLSDMEDAKPSGNELGRVLEGAKYRIDCGRCTCGLYSRETLDRYVAVARH